MNAPASLPSRLSRARWALLLLSLSACLHKETGNTHGTIRLKRNGEWQSMEELSTSLASDAPGLLSVCGGLDPLPNAVDDESGLCVVLQLDAAVLGSGPRTLAIDGTAQVPPARPPSVSYTPGAGQASEVKSAWASTSCFGMEPPGTVTHTLRGALRFTENSATRLAGHLTLDVEGTTYGPCSGEAAEFDVDFDVAR